MVTSGTPPIVGGTLLFRLRHFQLLRRERDLILTCAFVVAVGCGTGPQPSLASDISSEHPEAAPDSSAEQLPGPDQDPLKYLEARDIVVAKDAVPVPMRDGVRLSAYVILPKVARPDTKFPTILIKTPYVASIEFWVPLNRIVLSRMIREGYAIVVANDRGTQWSEGEYHLQKGAKQDGYDTLSWIAQQTWSNGNVGTFGCSSSAESQWALATMNHPAHKAAVIMAGPAGVGVIPGFHDQGIFYTGGVPSLNWAWWYLKFGHQFHPHLPNSIPLEERTRLAAAYSSQSRQPIDEDLSLLANHLPSEDILRAANAPTTEFDRLIALSPADSAWMDYDFLRTGDRTRVPSLHIDSWYDTLEVYGTTKAFEYLSGNSPNQHLVIGPTAHCRMGTERQSTMVGDRDVGDARFDYASLIVRWFDHWLRNEGNGAETTPPVQYYSLNSNKWRSAAAWPPRDAKPLKFFLRGRGHANSLFGDGRLDTAPAEVSEGNDQYIYDPSVPVPSQGGGCCTSRVVQDQSNIEARNDVLVYTSSALKKEVEIAGYIRARLFVASSAPDTDLMFKLVDVYPDGRAFNVLDTAQRLRYRDSFEAPRLMEKGRIYQVTLGEMAVASRFPVGHRIRIEVTGSNFPNYERNMNTGGRNFDELTPVTAVTRLFHDSQHASFVEFPMLPE
jgi:putative CocE/NonD family hydrolase